MKKLVFYALVAATALVPAGLSAETSATAAAGAHAAGARAAPGVSWNRAAVRPRAPMVRPGGHGRGHAMGHPGRRPTMSHPGKRFEHRGKRFEHRGRMVHSRDRFDRRGGHGKPHRPRFPHVKRFHHGFFLPNFWWGPQFHVQNWGLYGFAQPYGDQRWIRHYDDAYLIDGEGRVHDSRYGMDWDRYGEDWGYDRNGIPIYGGGGDYAEEDYGYEEGGYDEGTYREGYQGYGHGAGYGGGCGQPGPQPHGGSYTCSYAYPAWGYGTVTITETTTTTPTIVTETYYEDRAVHHPKRKWRSKPHRKWKPKPPPAPGERG